MSRLDFPLDLSTSINYIEGGKGGRDLVGWSAGYLAVSWLSDEMLSCPGLEPRVSDGMVMMSTGALLIKL